MTVPQGERGGAGKIILIVLAVIFALVLIVVGIIGYGVWKVSRAFHSDKDGQVTISTPEGNFSGGGSKNYTAADLGVDPYPGAKSTGGFNMDTDKGSAITAVYETTDSVDQVVSFYKGKTGLGEQTYMNTGSGAMISYKNGETEATVITIGAANSSDNKKTTISIMHSKNK
jgi:hypothetical protein